MSKVGILQEKSDGVLASRIKYSGWALCIGAGISTPAFPTWDTLVARLVKEDKSVDDAPALATQMLSSYSPDTLIQAAQDRLAMDDDQFRQLLVNCLYEDIKEKVSLKGWPAFAKALSSRLPRNLKRKAWGSYLTAVRTAFPDLPCLGLATLIGDLIAGDSREAPSAILSFNAEPMFYSLLNAHFAVFCGSEARPDLAAKPNGLMDRVIRLTSTIPDSKVPYYFCHGLLPVPEGVKSTDQEASFDKLVFSENEYLELANSVFSWQSSVFLANAVSRSMVFAGVSLSDSNMRRWLAWVHRLRTTELRQLRDLKSPSTFHLWITRRPDDVGRQRWMESCVANLGVRIVWLDDWKQLTETLRRMLSITEYPERESRQSSVKELRQRREHHGRAP